MTEPMTELDRRAARKGGTAVLYYVAATTCVALAGHYLRSGMCGPGLDYIVLLSACLMGLMLWVRSAVLLFAKDKAYKYSFAVHTLVCGGLLLLVTFLALGS
jgi:hypothetical protein